MDGVLPGIEPAKYTMDSPTSQQHREIHSTAIDNDMTTGLDITDVPVALVDEHGADLIDRNSQKEDTNDSATGACIPPLMSATIETHPGAPIVLNEGIKSDNEAMTDPVAGHPAHNLPDATVCDNQIEIDTSNADDTAVPSSPNGGIALPTENATQESLHGPAEKQGPDAPPLENDPNGEWEVDSDPETSGSSDSSDSDSSSDSDGEGYELMDPATAARMLMADGGGDDEDDDSNTATVSKVQVRTKNEKAPEPIPRPDVTITPETKLQPLGQVSAIVDNMALVRGDTSGEYCVLEQGSVLCLEDRSVMGAVAETFGRVQEPMYSVAFTDREEIDRLGIKVGAKILYAEGHSDFVFTKPLRAQKFTDASNIHDEEPGQEEIEFSDDEAEAAYKKAKKEAKRKGKSGANTNDQAPSSYIPTTAQTSISYDDEDDAGDSYTPLARPGSQTITQQPRGGRGRGRGDFGRGRGRGGRGRGDGQRFHNPPDRAHDQGQQPPPQNQSWNAPPQQVQPASQYPPQPYGQAQQAAYQGYQPPQQFPQYQGQQQTPAFNPQFLIAAQQQYMMQYYQQQQQQQQQQHQHQHQHQQQQTQQQQLLQQQEALRRMVQQQQAQQVQPAAPAAAQNPAANPQWAGQAMQEHLARLRQQMNYGPNNQG